MRLAPILLLLPTLAVADEQKPFLDVAKGWFEQAKSYIPTGIPSVSPIDAGASVVAANNVEKININNYKRKFAPSPDGPTDWIIMVTGKNESCFGGCEPANLKWNVSALLRSGRRFYFSTKNTTNFLLGICTPPVRTCQTTSPRLPGLRQRTSPLRSLGGWRPLDLASHSPPSNARRNRTSARQGFRTDALARTIHQQHNCYSTGNPQDPY